MPKFDLPRAAALAEIPRQVRLQLSDTRVNAGQFYQVNVVSASEITPDAIRARIIKFVDDWLARPTLGQPVKRQRQMSVALLIARADQCVCAPRALHSGTATVPRSPGRLGA